MRGEYEMMKQYCVGGAAREETIKTVAALKVYDIFSEFDL